MALSWWTRILGPADADSHDWNIVEDFTWVLVQVRSTFKQSGNGKCVHEGNLSCASVQKRCVYLLDEVMPLIAF
jgi:hypothetical protein